MLKRVIAHLILPVDDQMRLPFLCTQVVRSLPTRPFHQGVLWRTGRMNFIMLSSPSVRKRSLLGVHQKVERGVAYHTVLVLFDALRYIDGQYCKLTEHSCKVPVVCRQFSDYSVPQMSKHRKRANTSLSAQVLWSHSNRLFTSLQGGFWDQVRWKALKAKVESLTRMLQKYADIISEKRLKMLELHRSQLNSRFLRLPTLQLSNTSPHVTLWSNAYKISHLLLLATPSN